MNWILIAISTGMLMTANFETEEACLGRKAMLEKDKIINSKCVNMSPVYFTGSSNSISILPTYTPNK
jgi:hypothetical protein